MTGPALGSIIGGSITTKLGGFKSKKSLIVTLCFCLICAGCSVPLPYVNNFKDCVVLLWFLLFFGASILPCMTGIMLNTVDEELKTMANSLAFMSYNFLGKISPFIYGLVYDSG